MRFFEVIELTFLVLFVLGYCVPRRFRPGMLAVLPILALICAVVSTQLEGYRAQMAPAHALGVVFTLYVILERRYGKPPHQGPRRWWQWTLRIGTPVLALALLVPSVGFPYMFHVPIIPEPTGKYEIGTSHFSITDPNRLEHWTADPYDHRELMVKVWYPAVPDENSKPAPYSPSAREASRVIGKLTGLPGFWFDYLGLVKSHSWWDAPISEAEDKYPIILFSHGYLVGTMTQNSVLMEELASHGYIVMSIGHTYESMLIPHADGRVLAMDRERAQRFWGEVNRTNGIQHILTLGHTEEELKSIYQAGIYAVPTLDDSLHTWDQDVHFINDMVDELNKGIIPSPFEGRIDLTKRGVCGMSFGGTVTVRTALTDHRFSAALNLDGPVLTGEIFDCKHEMPFMHIINNRNTNSYNVPVDGAEGPVYRVMVSGTKHLNFADVSIFAPRFGTLRNALGKIDGYLMMEIVNDYSLAFFNQHLKDIPSTLLAEENGPYAEVKLESRNAPHTAGFSVAQD